MSIFCYFVACKAIALTSKNTKCRVFQNTKNAKLFKKKKVVMQLWNFGLFFNKIIVGFFSSFLMATFFKSRCNAMTSIFDINNEELCKKKNNQRKPSRRRMILNFPQGSFWATLLCNKNSGMSGDHFQISDWYL